MKYDCQTAPKKNLLNVNGHKFRMRPVNMVLFFLQIQLYSGTWRKQKSWNLPRLTFVKAREEQGSWGFMQEGVLILDHGISAVGVGEDSWESLGLQGDQPVHPKGDQSWVFIGRTDMKAETPIPWPPHAKSWLIGKDPDAGRDWGQEEKGTTEDEMAGWHHQLDGQEFRWTPGVGDGRGGLACCGSWGHKKSDRTEWVNWTELSAAKVGVRKQWRGRHKRQW